MKLNDLERAERYLDTAARIHHEFNAPGVNLTDDGTPVLHQEPDLHTAIEMLEQQALHLNAALEILYPAPEQN